MLLATVLALGAAVLHAGWNLVAKRAEGDRFVVLWAQFACAGVIAAVALAVHAAVEGMPARGYLWAAASGTVHLPYVWLLARAYTVSDFSVSYPIARGGGAALAAIGGVLFLADSLSPGEVAGITVVVVGLTILSWRASASGVALALAVAVTIGAYTLFDAQGARTTGSAAYVLASFCATTVTTTVFGLASGRRAAMALMMRRSFPRAATTGVASLVTYGMVLVAVQRAPVGYVTALRESSVVLAALVGWRYLGEGDHRRRITAAVTVLAGLLVLVLGR